MKKTLTLLILHYFRVLAKVQISKVKLLQKIEGKTLTIVGITGSAGKSSTLSACEAVLKDYFNVKTNGGSNSETGIPFSILGIKATSYSPIDWLKYTLLALIKLITNWQSYDIFLLEMGIDEPDEPKNMSYLLKIVRPTIGIFLNVNLVHSQQFDKTISQNITGDQRQPLILKNIGQEKANLINSLPSTGHALINSQDPIVSSTTQITLAKKTELKPIHVDLKKYAPPKSFDVSVSAAINLANIFKIDKSKAIHSLQKNLVLPPSRSSVFKGISNSTIIDSSYNSSPLACSEMLDVLSKYPSPKIAILGDMRELGLQSKSAHEKIYQKALKSADTIISVGVETRQYFGAKAIKFTDWSEANEYIKQNLKPNSTILIKGSQNTIYLEEIVKSLLQNPADASLICRQSPYWQKVKSTL
ncbi:hypothetical protein KBC75_01345 [Candidatus Shapirobacteria bacterium]|nr:hypothetical protein [Candidatus Shapirobacteria bacterium]